jgi:hypothetical protein
MLYVSVPHLLIMYSGFSQIPLMGLGYEMNIFLKVDEIFDILIGTFCIYADDFTAFYLGVGKI